jgi:hypothetical protein
VPSQRIATTGGIITEAHRKGLQVRDRCGVRYLVCWFDGGRGTLVEVPDVATAERVYHAANGEIASNILPVDLNMAEASKAYQSQGSVIRSRSQLRFPQAT